MKKYLLLLPLIGLCLLTSSCFQQHIEISLNENGSGTITEKTSLSAQMLAMMAGAPGGADEAIAGMVTDAKDKATKQAAVMGEGVALKSVEALNADGKKGTVTTYTFKDINKLKYSGDGGMSGGMDGGQEEIKETENPMQFSYKNGTLTLINEEPKADKAEEAADAGEDEEMSDQQLAMAQQMMGDMRVTIKLNFPGGIEKTNASHVDGNKLTILDLQMGKVLENPEKFKALNKEKPESPAEMLEILDGVEGVIIEPKSKVTVTLK